MSYAFRSINALLGPEIATEFGLGAAELGLLTSVYFLAFGLLQIPFGVLLDRYGPRRVDAGLLVVASIGALAYALAPSFAGVVAGRALIGAGVAVALMASFQAFVLWYPMERIATMNSRAFAVGILGAITVTVPLEAALRFADWRSIMIGAAALALAASATIFFVVPEHERDRSRVSLGATLAGIRVLIADPALRRVAVMAGTSQSAVVALSTLWIATWLRDVAGYDRAGVGQGLLVVNLALIAGFLVFGRMADARTRLGGSMLPIIAGGVALAALCLGLLVLGVVKGGLALWALFTFFGTAATLGYSMLSRRYPKELAGRVNTTLNTFIFIGMFVAQWAVGLVLERWPPTDGGYPPEAYSWALGSLWALQLAGLAWFWNGRRLLTKVPVDSAA
ncbi:MAG TPA: MFS transporter [Burkholderiales bacterium]|nr:MFS transporter [Burkholderiales bacterium]